MISHKITGGNFANFETPRNKQDAGLRRSPRSHAARGLETRRGPKASGQEEEAEAAKREVSQHV